MLELDTTMQTSLSMDFMEVWLSVLCVTQYSREGDLVTINLTIDEQRPTLKFDQFLEVCDYLVDSPNYGVDVLLHGFDIDQCPIKDVLVNFKEGRIVVGVVPPVLLGKLEALETGLKRPGHNDYTIECSVKP